LANSSSVGARARQGGHQEAQKSTNTGSGAWSTSVSKVLESTDFKFAI